MTDGFSGKTTWVYFIRHRMEMKMPDTGQIDRCHDGEREDGWFNRRGGKRRRVMIGCERAAGKVCVYLFS